jgi:hypothetical protein
VQTKNKMLAKTTDAMVPLVAAALSPCNAEASPCTVPPVLTVLLFLTKLDESLLSF